MILYFFFNVIMFIIVMEFKKNVFKIYIFVIRNKVVFVFNVEMFLIEYYVNGFIVRVNGLLVCVNILVIFLVISLMIFKFFNVSIVI